MDLTIVDPNLVEKAYIIYENEYCEKVKFIDLLRSVCPEPCMACKLEQSLFVYTTIYSQKTQIFSYILSEDADRQSAILLIYC